MSQKKKKKRMCISHLRASAILKWTATGSVNTYLPELVFSEEDKQGML